MFVAATVEPFSKSPIKQIACDHNQLFREFGDQLTDLAGQPNKGMPLNSRITPAVGLIFKKNKQLFSYLIMAYNVPHVNL